MGETTQMGSPHASDDGIPVKRKYPERQIERERPGGGKGLHASKRTWSLLDTVLVASFSQTVKDVTYPLPVYDFG